MSKHTCILALRQKDNRQVAPWVISAFIKRKYMSHSHNYLPKSITEDISHDYSIEMSYYKAWRYKEKALTYVETNEVRQFKYFIMNLGVSIRGFQSICGLVLCVDSSFLKQKCEGHILVAIALDTNNYLYPMAFTVVNS